MSSHARAGCCALRTADKPFWDTDELVTATAKRADVALVLFGTNDAKEFNWTTDDNFVEALVAMLREAAGTKRTLVLTPPPVPETHPRP